MLYHRPWFTTFSNAFCGDGLGYTAPHTLNNKCILLSLPGITYMVGSSPNEYCYSKSTCSDTVCTALPHQQHLSAAELWVNVKSHKIHTLIHTHMYADSHEKHLRDTYEKCATALMLLQLRCYRNECMSANLLAEFDIKRDVCRAFGQLVRDRASESGVFFGGFQLCG